MKKSISSLRTIPGRLRHTPEGRRIAAGATVAGLLLSAAMIAGPGGGESPKPKEAPGHSATYEHYRGTSVQIASAILKDVAADTRKARVAGIPADSFGSPWVDMYEDPGNNAVTLNMSESEGSKHTSVRVSLAVPAAVQRRVDAGRTPDQVAGRYAQLLRGSHGLVISSIEHTQPDPNPEVNTRLDMVAYEGGDDFSCSFIMGPPDNLTVATWDAQGASQGLPGISSPTPDMISKGLASITQTFDGLQASYDQSRATA